MKVSIYVSTLAICLATSIFPTSVATDDKHYNVFGEELASCSSSGMALTGYTRTGFCVDRNDDQGSHHICIDMKSTVGGNFCDVTGQSDWCSSSMPCQSDDGEVNNALDADDCPVEHWCVCQWAFASYIENAGGCEMIQDVVCEAVNIEAVRAYEKMKESKYQIALQCLADKCGISVE